MHANPLAIVIITFVVFLSSTAPLTHATENNNHAAHSGWTAAPGRPSQSKKSSRVRVFFYNPRQSSNTNKHRFSLNADDIDHADTDAYRHHYRHHQSQS